MPSLSDSRGIYAAAAIALLIIGLGVYIVSGFGAASVIFFLLSLVLMAGWFVLKRHCPDSPLPARERG